MSRAVLTSVLLLVFLAGLLLRLEEARTPRTVHPDEIFQTLEPAHRLAYGYGVVTWEWRLGTRSWAFPALLAAIMRASDWIRASPTVYLRAVSVILSLGSLSTIWFGFAWGRRAVCHRTLESTGETGLEAAIVAAIGCAIWYELVIFGPRAFTEVVAAHVLLPGLYLGTHGTALSEKTRMFLSGLLCGLAVAFRPQLAPAALFAAIYFCRPRWRERWRAVAAGLLVPLISFGLVDAWTWSYPFQSFFRYVWVNIVEGRSKLYGTEPWYWYVGVLAQHMGLLVLFAVIGAARSPFLAGI